MRGSTRIGCFIALVLGGMSSHALATDVCGGVSGTFGTGGSPYVATCDLLVGLGDTLIIDAGVEVRFAAGTGLTVDGTLQVNGTSVGPVLLTSDLIAPAPGDWAQIAVNGAASLDWASMSYGSGIVATGSLDVADSVFKDNGGTGFSAAIAFGSGTTGSVTNSLFSQNQIPLSLGTNATPNLSGLTVQLDHSVVNGIEVAGGAWTVSRTWTNHAAPYAFSSSPTFVAGTAQTLAAGVIFKLFAPDDLVFDQLTVLGSVGEPVIFTSIWDDAAGGDTFPGPATLPAAGDWGDLNILGMTTIDHLQVRFGSGGTLQGSATVAQSRFSSNAGGMSVLAGADFSSCVFEFNQNEPSLSFGPGAAGSVTNSVFDAGRQPLSLAVDADPSFNNLTIKPNHTVLNGVSVQGGAWSISRTWDDPSAPYVLDASIGFGLGTTQTVGPGVVFKMFPAAAPAVDMAFDGLTALGTSAQPIVFTSLGDLNSGNTLPAGLPDPAEGDWGLLEVAAAADLDNVTVRYGTSVDLLDTATIVDSRFISEATGVVVHSMASFSGSLFIGNSLVAASSPALTFLPGTSGTVSSSFFSLNHVPILLGLDSNPNLSSLTIVENHTLLNAVQVEGGSWTVSRTWTDAGAPYMPDGDINFIAPTTQTMNPGAVFKFVPFGGPPLLMKFANLMVIGTASQPVIFTSALDGTIAPNALVGATGTPAAGDWVGLIAVSGGVHQMNHTRVSYAETGLLVDAASGVLDQNRFTDNQAGIGIVSGGFARVTATDFINNKKGVALDALSSGDLGNLGDADPLNDGLNSFVCNVFHVENLNTTTLAAENNSWNEAAPDPSFIFGPVDDVPFLVFAPRAIITNLMVSLDVTGNDIVLEWEDRTPLCGYRVLRSTDPDSGFIDISGLVNTPIFVDPGAGIALEDYFYRIIVD